jgi:hypothetical protein
MIDKRWDGASIALTNSQHLTVLRSRIELLARVATFPKSLNAEIQKAFADPPKISSDRPLRDELTTMPLDLWAR